MKIVMVGTGYVGLVSGTCLAEVGHEVTCVDIDAKKIEMLKDGRSPIYEPGLEIYIKRNLRHDRLNFSQDLKSAISGARATFIAVGTPEGEDGSADLKYVMAAARDIARALTGPMTVVVKSTVPIGTCDQVAAVIDEELAKRKVTFSVTVASNPEFLKEGAAIDDFMKPDRIVCGVDCQGDRELFAEIYSPFVQDDPSKLQFMDRRSSELTKYAANAMLATRISFMNELAQLIDKVGGDIDLVRRGIGLDSRIGKKFLYSGPGYGGSCFPKDVQALIRTAEGNGVPLSVLQAVNLANDNHKSYVASKVIKHFSGDLSGKKIALWGLAFKPETDDVRESPALTIVKDFLGAGAQVVAHDPEANGTFHRALGEVKGISYCDDPYGAITQADALVLVTEWPTYKRPNWAKVAELMRQRIVFDFRNQYDFARLKELGFHYQCIGRPDSIRHRF